MWIAFLSVNEIRELYPVPDEENGSIVPDHIPVAFLRVEFHGETAWVAFRIPGALLAAHRREANEHLSLLAERLKKLGFGPLRDVPSDFEHPMSAGSLCVDNAFRNAFAIEMRHLFDKQQVLN